MKPRCPMINDRGRVCQGELELYYESEGGQTQIYECDEHNHLWLLDGVVTQGRNRWPQWKRPVPDVSYLDRLIFKFKQWREENADAPFLGTLKNLWGRFKDLLPSIRRGGTRKIPSSSADDFEKLPPKKITSHSVARRSKKKEKPSFAEVVEKHV